MMLVFVTARGICCLLVIVLLFRYSLCLTHSTSENRAENQNEKGKSLQYEYCSLTEAEQTYGADDMM
jgi:hypothetical protein